MFAPVVLACSLVFAEVPTPDPAELTETSSAATADAGRDADSHVRLALQCERQGMTSERLRHLVMAVLIEPSHAVARGLMGMVQVDGRWRRPDQSATLAQSDAEQATVLAEYNTRRARMHNTADDHWQMALWCADHGLGPEAAAHFTAVTRLDPRRDAAWKHLGFAKHNGRWKTADQIAAERVERDAQNAADRHWRPRLRQWRQDLNNSAKRVQADTALSKVTDPRAVVSIWSLFGLGGPDDQRQAVRLLGQIHATGSSRALALLAAFGSSAEVRRAASETLRWRDDREFLNLLISLLRDPIRYQYQPLWSEGIASPGILVADGPMGTVYREYQSAVEVLSDATGISLAELLARWERSPSVRSALGRAVSADGVQSQFMADDMAEIDAHNAAVVSVSEGVWQALSMIRGKDLGTDPEAWRSWAADVQGYAYRKYNSGKKRVLFQFVGGYDCFSAGTMVRTRIGPRPIQDVKVGDQVLAQDTRTGALGFRPVLSANHYPPVATMRIDMGDEAIVATGIHRFWIPGRGWALARDLKPGDPVRVVGGTRTLSSVQPDQPQPVFNLEVAEGHTFFVGKAGALVHDDSLALLDVEPFDAAAASPRAAAGK
jgi:hypothetical protein